MGSSIMVIGILLLLSVSVIPSSAQDNACWADISPCLETAKAQNYAKEAVVLCCPSITNAVNFDLPCFCLAKADLESQQNGLPIFNNILIICNVPGTFETICPDTPSSAPTEAPMEAPMEAPTADPEAPSEAPSAL